MVNKKLNDSKKSKSRNSKKSRKSMKGGNKTLDQCLNEIKTFNLTNEYTNGFNCMSGGGSCKHIKIEGMRLDRNNAYLNIPRRQTNYNMSGGNPNVDGKNWENFRTSSIPGENANSFGVMLAYASMPKIKLDYQWQELPFKFETWNAASQYLHKYYPSLKAKIVPSLENPSMNLVVPAEDQNKQEQQFDNITQNLGNGLRPIKGGRNLEDKYVENTLEGLNQLLGKKEKTFDNEQLTNNDKYKELHEKLVSKINNLRNKSNNVARL